MSIHPSLNISQKGKKQKTVLKRNERLKSILEKGLWKQGDSVFGLPKIKVVRMKIKKEKAEKAAVTAEGETAAPAQAAVPQEKPKAQKS